MSLNCTQVFYSRSQPLLVPRCAMFMLCLAWALPGWTPEASAPCSPSFPMHPPNALLNSPSSRLSRELQDAVLQPSLSFCLSRLHSERQATECKVTLQHWQVLECVPWILRFKIFFSTLISNIGSFNPINKHSLESSILSLKGFCDKKKVWETLSGSFLKGYAECVLHIWILILHDTLYM